MKPSDLLDLLQGLYRDKLALTRRHQEAACWISSYEFNNAYQYVLARDETHLAWLRSAIVDLGGTVPEAAGIAAGGPPSPGPSASADASAGFRRSLGAGESVAKQDVAALLQEDVRLAQSFVSGWRDRVDGITNARQKTMIKVIIGETLEHVRTFQQASAGRTDLLGRRADGAGTPGRVLPTRWLE